MLMNPQRRLRRRCAAFVQIRRAPFPAVPVVWNSPSGMSHWIGVPVSTVTVYAATENSGMQKRGARASERERDPSV